MKLIIGLGNPGEKYANTRHNVGFQCIDIFRNKLNLAPFTLKSRLKSEISDGIFNNEKIVLAKPQTFMNLSGEAVLKIRDFYKCEGKDMLIVYDDVDLPLGHIRIRQRGSAGSHNGMKSIIGNLGSDNFARLRIGIESRGLSSPLEQDIASFVLHNFTGKEKPILKKTLEKASLAVLSFIESGLPKTMEQFN